MQREHQMYLKCVHSRDDGFWEEWICPTCGYRFELQWPPEQRKIVLNRGDENATHSGDRGVGVTWDTAQPEGLVDGIDYESTAEAIRRVWWEDALGEMRFEELWNG